MKKLFLGCLLAGSMMLLNSCLDGENTSSTDREYYGFVEMDMKAGGNVIYYNDLDYPLYSPSLSPQIADGECCLIQFSINSDDNQNVTGLGYYTIREAGYHEVDKGNVIPVKTDTAVNKANELAMATLLPRNYVRGYLFIDLYHESMDTDQKNYYELSYNPDQEPVVENAKNVYQLYLRAAKLGDGKSPKTNQIMPNAFGVKRFFDTISYTEKNKGNSEYYFKINYVKSFAADSVSTWAATDVQTIGIPAEE
jgi:hypothetical protein